MALHTPKNYVPTPIWVLFNDQLLSEERADPRAVSIACLLYEGCRIHFPPIHVSWRGRKMGTDAGASSGGDVDLADIPIYDSMTNGVGNKQGYNTEDSHIEGGHGAVQCTTEDRWTDNGIEGEHEHESPKPLVRELSDEIDVPSSAAELAATERANFQSGGSHKSGSWSEDDGGPLTPVHFPTSSEIKQSFNVPDISLETNGLEERNNNFQDGEEKVFNPFSLPASMSQKTRNAHISEALGSTSAVELSLACREVVRRELFVRNNILVVILGAGIVPNSWEELYRTEAVKDTRSPEFVRKIPLPASTELDRDAEYNIRVYNFVDGQSGDIGDMEYIGETTTSIRALMNAPHMTMEKSLTSPRNRRVRGYISICLDIILHEEKKEATTFDFGFTECAPMVRFHVHRTVCPD